jgi:transcriptional regulator with XRE-family HTH domain
LRKQKGLSQEKFAEAINIATTSLSFIETGRGFMTLATLEKMATVLNVEPYEIFQFISLQSNEEMFNFIIQKVQSIKENNEKLKTVYNILKNIL